MPRTIAVTDNPTTTLLEMIEHAKEVGDEGDLDVATHLFNKAAGLAKELRHEDLFWIIRRTYVGVIMYNLERRPDSELALLLNRAVQLLIQARRGFGHANNDMERLYNEAFLGQYYFLIGDRAAYRRLKKAYDDLAKLDDVPASYLMQVVKWCYVAAPRATQLMWQDRIDQHARQVS